MTDTDSLSLLPTILDNLPSIHNSSSSIIIIRSIYSMSTIQKSVDDDEDIETTKAILLRLLNTLSYQVPVLRADRELLGTTALRSNEQILRAPHNVIKAITESLNHIDRLRTSSIKGYNAVETSSLDNQKPTRSHP